MIGHGSLRSFWRRVLEATGIVVSLVLWFVLAARAWRSVDGLADVAIVMLALLTAYAAADWVSGLAHWFCDTFFAEDTPVIGATLIQPFREHHRDPLAMTRHGFLELNANNSWDWWRHSERPSGLCPRRRPAPLEYSPASF